MRLCELREKEVINICNCRRLGCVVDVDIDVCDGKVLAIIIPVPGKICGILGSDGEYVIPFGCIKKSGRISFWWKSVKKSFAKVLDVGYNGEKKPNAKGKERRKRV